MVLKCGIVGLPNVGKSTLFNALTSAQVPAEIYPFTTIDPNVGVVSVPDERLSHIADILNSEKVIPTTLRIVDIAGLIAGSHKGEGLGNQFLAQIREVDAIIHIVRCFSSEKVSHISDTLDPVRDIEIVETEIILKDLETVNKRKDAIAKKVKVGDKEATGELEVLTLLSSSLDRGIPARNIDLDADEQTIISHLFLLSAKPVMYMGNVNEEEETSHHFGKVGERLRSWGDENHEHVLLLSAALEEELSLLTDEEEHQFFMNEWDINKTGLETLINEAYSLLDLITFFTTESNHAQAWTIKSGTAVNQAAGVIHTDFQRGFIKADVYHYNDLMTYRSETALRESGKFRTEGKDYIVRDGDIIFFKFNV